MKCPKCHYLGFETGDRCKNCGYDFSLLSAPESDPDLSLKPPAHDDVPVGDLWLDHGETTPSTPSQTFTLFSPSGDDEPLIKTPSEPRVPLSVRRTPDMSRVRAAARPAREVDNGLTLQFAEEQPVEPTPIKSSVIVHPPAVSMPSRVAAASISMFASSDETPVAGLGKRLLAACIDHGILLGIDFVVFYSTLRMTALETDEWRALPLLPLLAFLLLMKLSYFCAFTAMSGQTIGKMAAGIRVVADDHQRMDPARAIKRTLTGVLSLGSLGLGLVPALIDPDRRAFHDRVAHTHVIDLPSA